MVLLGILCVAHWAVLWRGMFIVESTWNAEISACYVTQTNPGLLNVTFFYSACRLTLISSSTTRPCVGADHIIAIAFDFTVLIFTTVALTYKHSARTDLWKLLFQDGLVYFVRFPRLPDTIPLANYHLQLLTFSSNCIPAVLNVLNLNGRYLSLVYSNFAETNRPFSHDERHRNGTHPCLPWPSR